jgi:hypothetical protein
MGSGDGDLLMIVRFTIAAAAALLLGACQTTGVGSVGGGECKIFERPQYVVLGKRQYDQDWIDSQVEGGVGGCGWQRPQARPASLDAVPGQKAKVVAKPVKKRGLIKRIKDRVVHPFTKPVEPVIESPPPPVVAAPAPPSLAPRDPVDELLQPSMIRKVN